jgi:hypothetical protein
MRTRYVFLTFTMAVACGGEGPMLYSDLGGGSSSTGGSAAGTGGTLATGGIALGSGGAVLATGGLAVGSGGAILATGGSVAGSGGAVLGTGGIARGTGGAVLGTGGSTIGRGGALGSGGAVVGSGGSAVGRGGAIGTGGAIAATGGIGSGGGGVIGGRGGSGGSTSESCSAWTNADDCRKAGCMTIAGVKDGISEISTFFECIRGSCTGANTAAYPTGRPGNCYVFSSGCIPDGWTPLGGSRCPTGTLKPSIASLKIYQDCMPSPVTADGLTVTFAVKYDNVGQSQASIAIVKSASLTYADTSTVPFAVTPSDSGVVPAGQSLTVIHNKSLNTLPGIGCVCGTAGSVTLNVTWETGGQIGTQTVTSSLGASASCAY